MGSEPARALALALGAKQSVAVRAFRLNYTTSPVIDQQWNDP